MRKITSLTTRSMWYIFCVTALFVHAVSAQESQTKFIEPSAPAEGSGPLSGSLRTAFVSDYVYRGLLLYEGVSIQPSGGVFYSFGDYGTIGASLWMHISAEDSQDTFNYFDESGNFIVEDLNQKFFELDPTVSYDVSIDALTLSVGHIWYTDPGYGKREIYVNDVRQELGEKAPDTAEFYFGISADVIGQPQLTVYYDYRTIEYVYYALGFSHDIEIPAMGEGFRLKPFVTFGFASESSDDIEVYKGDGLEHINLGVTTSIKWGVLQVKPNFTYVFSTEEEENGDSNTTEQFVVGVDFVYDFSI